MLKKPKKEDIKWNKEKQRIVITKEEEIDIKGDNLQDVEKKLRKELDVIVGEVKAKKLRAEEIKELLQKIKEAKTNGNKTS